MNVLRFTRDGAALVSGSDDSGVSVWSTSRYVYILSEALVTSLFDFHRLLDEDTEADLVTPFCTLSDHTLPVTDIVCGVGPFPACRVLTSSMDHSVKVGECYSFPVLQLISHKDMGPVIKNPIINVSVPESDIVFILGYHRTCFLRCLCGWLDTSGQLVLSKGE